MKFERSSQEKTQEQVHRVRITLSSKNVKNLEKVCAELVGGAKDKRLKVKGDEVTPEIVSPITTRGPCEVGMYTPKPQRPSKKGCTNFRWSPSMTRFLLPFLINQANMGLKMGRAFKREAFLAAAEAVTEKFKLKCNDGNVENHLRTIKTRYQQIKKLQCLSNTIWDEKEKKIIMDEKEYGQYIATHPRDEPFLNKRIDMYDEMVFICGEDQFPDNSVAIEHTKETNEGMPELTIGDDVNIMLDDEDVEIEEVGEATPPTPPAPSSRSPLVSTSSGSSGRTGQSGKKRKSHHLGDKIDYLASQIGDLAEAIRSSRKGISSELFSEVMKCEGYDEMSLGRAFDYLHEHENLARGFLVKSPTLRQAWLADFFSECGPKF